MSTTQKVNTPKDSWNAKLTKLTCPCELEYSPVAEQARAMGLKVGDVIVGREFRACSHWWQETRLTLVWMGQSVCVWKTESRNKALPEFHGDREKADWELANRDWYLAATMLPKNITPPLQRSASVA